MAAKFTAALARADRKAPIYVSFGDTDSGPNRIRELFNDITTSAEAEFQRQLEADLRSSLKNGDLNDPKLAETLLPKLLRQSLQKAYESTGKNESLTNHIAEMAQQMGQQTDAAIAFYLAAVAEDPTYKPAWFRLAQCKDEKLASRALDALEKADPTIPWSIACGL